MNREPPFLLKVKMDPYNNLYDFIKLTHPHRNISKDIMASFDVATATYMHNKKVLMKQELLDMMTYPAAVCADIPESPLAYCTKANAPAQACMPWKNKKEEIPMSSSYSTATVITADSVEQTQRRTLRDFAYEAFEAKKTAARKQFGLMGDDAPETMEEAIARILAGKYVLTEKNKDRCAYSFMSYIAWRDPSIVEDKDGYKAAKAVLQTAYDKLALRLNILPLQDALAEVEAYSAK